MTSQEGKKSRVNVDISFDCKQTDIHSYCLTRDDGFVHDMTFLLTRQVHMTGRVRPTWRDQLNCWKQRLMQQGDTMLSPCVVSMMAEDPKSKDDPFLVSPVKQRNSSEEDLHRCSIWDKYFLATSPLPLAIFFFFSSSSFLNLFLAESRENL